MAHGTTLKFVSGDHIHVDQPLEEVLRLAEKESTIRLTTGGNAREMFVNWSNVVYAWAAD